MVFFRVNDVTVAGQGRYTEAEIVTASGIELGSNLYGVNKFQAAKNIRSTLPYVDTVSIRRALPDGLIIQVTECVPAALIRGGSSWWVVDAKGKLLEETKSSAREGVAVVTGLTAVLPAPGTTLAVNTEEGVKLESLLGLVAAFSERGMMDKVSAVDLTGSANLILVYDGRFNVKMPMNRFPARALEEVVARLQPNDRGDIDMTRKEDVRFISN